ncbi:MAG: ABC transporter ATP-binding protein [Candidatus Electrothrix communis]|nr:MAG: ABC transporter ATP-binding protein [Candidatus Electrothrix communis]
MKISAEKKLDSPALLARCLCKQYKGAASPALHDFNLEVGKGEFFGLLGPNGAGKTTALSIFSGLFPPDSGTLQIAGKQFCKQAKAIKQIFGLVPQEIALYDNLTAQEHLIFFGKLHGLSRERLRKRVTSCLEIAGLVDRASRLVSTYSGGMKRRLNIAAALLHEPQILFLDEPTVGVDAQSRNMIHEQLQEANQGGTTIIYTSHSMDEAQKLCTRIGIIEQGSIVRQGVPASLIAESGLNNLEELFLHLTGRQLRDA